MSPSWEKPLQAVDEQRDALTSRWTRDALRGVCRMEAQMGSMSKMLEDPVMKGMMMNMMRGMDSETLAKMTGMPPEQVLPAGIICSVMRSC